MSYLKEMNRPMTTTNSTKTPSSKMTQATLNAMEEDDTNSPYKFVLIDKQNSRLARVKSKHNQNKSLLASNLSVISKETVNTTNANLSTNIANNPSAKDTNGKKSKVKNLSTSKFSIQFDF
jgi:hypothetical protein